MLHTSVHTSTRSGTMTNKFFNYSWENIIKNNCTNIYLSYLTKGKYLNFMWNVINMYTKCNCCTLMLVTGLQPNKKYEVRVLAATQQGWPTLSDVDLPWTLVETPSVTSYIPLLPPPTIQLTVINSTTIQVQYWFFFLVETLFPLYFPICRKIVLNQLFLTLNQLFLMMKH